MSEVPVDIPKIKVRIQGLSDIVFGLALSIGSLELISNLPQTPAAYGAEVALFVFSFMLVVASWFLYSRVMSVLPVEVRGALILNVVLLLCVALEPYTLWVLDNSQTISFLTWSSLAYGLDVGVTYLVLGGLAYILLAESKRSGNELRVHPAILQAFRRTMRAEFFLGGLFAISALPFFWVLTPIGYLRFDIWYLSIGAFYFWWPRGRRNMKSASAAPDTLGAGG